MKIITVFSLAIIMFSCKTKEICVLNKNFISGVGIYFLTSDSISKEKCEQLAKTKFPEFKHIDSLSGTANVDAYSIKFIKNRSEDFTPPDTNALVHFGKNLSRDEKLKLQDYNGIIIINFCGTSKNVFEKQKRIAEFISFLIESKEVIILDLNSFEWFNRDSWKTNRILNFNDSIKDITSQIAIHTYRTGEYCRTVTMGMNKFCLPEISIKDFSCSNQNSFGSLINTLAQTLSENPVISEDSTITLNLNKIKNETVRTKLRTDLKKNAKEITTIRLKNVSPEQGDNLDKQLLIAFENIKYSSSQEEQENVIANLFGAGDSRIFTYHDSVILNLSKKAKQRLPELRVMFNKGLAPGYSILVKAPFKTDNEGREWMWVEVTKWTAKSMMGILQNDAFEIKSLKAGAIVHVNENDIFDYILYKPDGSYEGNETGKLLEKRN